MLPLPMQTFFLSFLPLRIKLPLSVTLSKLLSFYYFIYFLECDLA